MRTQFVEATQNVERGFNHGKFLVGIFEKDERQRNCEVDFRYAGTMRPLVARCGWSDRHVLVLDLQTGEGAFFLPGGLSSADLDKHRIWVCPMFEPLLAWLYEWTRELNWFARLPTLVELPGAPEAVSGYRRPGLPG